MEEFTDKKKEMAEKRMNEFNIRPLDFVRPKGNKPNNMDVIISEKGVSYIETKGEPYSDRYVGLVTEISDDGRCSVEWLGNGNRFLKSAWWKQEELLKEDSLPNLLAREMVHPFGNNSKLVDNFYPKK